MTKGYDNIDTNQVARDGFIGGVTAGLVDGAVKLLTGKINLNFGKAKAGSSQSGSTNSGSPNAKGSASTTQRAGSTVPKETDFYVTPQGDAIPGTEAGYKNNLSMMENANGKYVGEGSNGVPVRVRVEGVHPPTNVSALKLNPYHEVPHIHVEYKQNIFTGGWGAGSGSNHTLPQNRFK
ncbi:MAG: hypothetical protein ABFC62_08675 [Clostridiaceae bacterium]